MIKYNQFFACICNLAPAISSSISDSILKHFWLYDVFVWFPVGCHSCAVRIVRSLLSYCIGYFKSLTTGQNNLTKRPHRRRTWTVQSYSPGGVSVHPHVIRASLHPPESTYQTASRSFQPLLQGSRSWQTNQQTDIPTDRQTTLLRL